MRSMPYLPPLLEFYDGTPVRTRTEWDRRKAEMRRLLQRYFLGQFPKKTPRLINTRVLNETRLRGSIGRSS